MARGRNSTNAESGPASKRRKADPAKSGAVETANDHEPMETENAENEGTNGFLENTWKEIYFKLKRHDNNIEQEIEKIAKSSKIRSIQTSLVGLISYMGNSFNLKPTQDVLELLRKHKKYQSAELLLKKALAKVAEKSLWTVIAAIILLSENVSEIYDILKCLDSDFNAVNALYCIATFLLYTKRQYKVGYDLHYRVFHSLYLFENRFSRTLDNLVESRISSSDEDVCKLTEEQNELVNHNIQPGDVVIIEGLAGSGKTTAWVKFVENHQDRRFLVVMFNKAVIDGMQNLLPPNATYLTLNSLTWETQDLYFKNELSSCIIPEEVLSYLDNVPTGYIGFEKKEYLRCVMATVMNFLCSEDSTLADHHIPTVWFGYPTEAGPNKEHVREDCKRLLKKAGDINGLRELVELREKGNVHRYDCIIVDGIEDCTRENIKMIFSNNCAKMLVSDENQAIYGFLGAVNALKTVKDQIKDARSFQLSRPFRFSPKIAHVTTLLLDALKQYDQEVLIGGTRCGDFMWSPPGQTAILARKNKVLFDEARRIIGTRPRNARDPNEQARSTKFSFIGGAEDDSFKEIRDLSGYTDSLEDAEVVFSTVHRSKGFEFDTVYLLDDLGEGRRGTMEEVNILYVAITRAKKSLRMSHFLSSKLLEEHERFEHPIVGTDNKPTLKLCAKCKRMFILSPGSFYMARNRPEIVDDHKVEVDYVCLGCCKPTLQYYKMFSEILKYM